MSEKTLEHMQVEAVLVEAQRLLTRSGDLVDPDRSIRHLLDCLNCLVKAERLLHPGDATDQADEVIIRNLTHRNRQKLFSTETTPETIEQLISFSNRRGTTTPDKDALLVNEAIPAVWRILKGVRADARSQRPLGIHWIRARRTVTYLLAAWLVYQFVRLILPFGAWVVYYNDMELKLPIAIRAEFDLFKDHGTNRPVVFGRRNGWSARWTGKIYAPRKDTYSFYIQSEDGVRFWIDDELIFDNWQDTRWKSSGRHAPVELTGGMHRFRLEQYKRDGTGVVRVRWTGGGLPPNTVLGCPYIFKY